MSFTVGPQTWDSYAHSGAKVINVFARHLKGARTRENAVHCVDLRCLMETTIKCPINYRDI